jgi:ABC-type uncharacterized transport system permease subunit
VTDSIILTIYVGFALLAVSGWNGVRLLRNPGEMHHRTAMRWFGWFASLCLAGGLLGIVLEHDTLPPRNLHETILVVLLALNVLALIVDAMFRLPVIPSVVALFGIPLLLTLIWQFHSAPTAETRIETPMDAIHVAAFILAYVFLGFSAIVAVFYLIVEQHLKSRRLTPWISTLPSLEISERLNRNALYSGFVLLTIGIVLGYLSQRGAADPADSRAWRLSPTVIRSTVIWFVYGGSILLRFRPGWIGRKSAYASVAAFLLILASILLKVVSNDFHG